MITQFSPASDRPSSFWILGSATTAMVLSIIAISCRPPIAITAAINRRDVSDGGMSSLVRPSVLRLTGIGSLIPDVVSSSEVVPALHRLAGTEATLPQPLEVLAANRPDKLLGHRGHRRLLT